MHYAKTAVPVWSGGTANKFASKKNRDGSRCPYGGFFPLKPVRHECYSKCSPQFMFGVHTRPAYPAFTTRPDLGLRVGEQVAVGPNMSRPLETVPWACPRVSAVCGPPTTTNESSRRSCPSSLTGTTSVSLRWVVCRSKVWEMVDGRAELQVTAPAALSDTTPPDPSPAITASVVLAEGRAAWARLLRADAQTDVCSLFTATHDGLLVRCEIRLRVHSTAEDQKATRAAWTGQTGSPVELNPPRSRYLSVNSALVSPRPRN